METAHFIKHTLSVCDLFPFTDSHLLKYVSARPLCVQLSSVLMQPSFNRGRPTVTGMWSVKHRSSMLVCLLAAICVGHLRFHIGSQTGPAWGCGSALMCCKVPMIPPHSITHQDKSHPPTQPTHTNTHSHLASI